jgi:hypothetical protein
MSLNDKEIKKIAKKLASVLCNPALTNVMMKG